MRRRVRNGNYSCGMPGTAQILHGSEIHILHLPVLLSFQVKHGCHHCSFEPYANRDYHRISCRNPRTSRYPPQGDGVESKYGWNPCLHHLQRRQCFAETHLGVPKHLVTFPELLFVFSMASRCSGRNTPAFVEKPGRRQWFLSFLYGCYCPLDGFSVGDEPLVGFVLGIEYLFLMPERSKTLCTSLFERTQALLLLYIVSSVYKRSYAIPAVCVYWLMRFFADSLRALLFGARPKTLSLSQVASPTFRHPLCAASLMREHIYQF